MSDTALEKRLEDMGDDYDRWFRTILQDEIISEDDYFLIEDARVAFSNFMLDLSAKVSDEAFVEFREHVHFSTL